MTWSGRVSFLSCMGILALWAAIPVGAAEPVVAEILLKGGTIIDGSGAAPVVGDVAVVKDRIVAVGQFDLKSADWTIDCTGLVIAPGFIDLHNHSDTQIVQRATRANINYLTQGCTTVVTGNCGFGPVNVAKYLAEIDGEGAGTNVIHLLAHGSLREQVLGKGDGQPSEAQLEEMKRLARQAMNDGAWGMSTGLIYVPGTYSKTEEIIEIAKICAQSQGLYASHIRDEGLQLLVAVDEALRIGTEGGLPVHISHFKSSGPDAWGLVREAAKRIEKARAAGQVVTADQYPYIASSTSLEATLLPDWCRAGGQEELLKRLDDPEKLARITDAIEQGLKRRGDQAPVRIARYVPRQDWVGLSLQEIAAKEQASPVEIVLTITKGGGAAVVSFSMNEEDVRHIMQIPWVATASDGRAYLPGADRPHPRNYGTFTRKIGHYALKEELFSLEFAVRSATGLPAEILRLTDRGLLKPGLAADIFVFDPKAILDTATFQNPHSYSKGVTHVFVNGQPAVTNGTPTGGLHGKALRHAAAPSKTGN